MIGKVGSDDFGAESIRQLEASGVDCTHVAVEPGDSGLAMITVGASGENTIRRHPRRKRSRHNRRSSNPNARSSAPPGIVLAQLEIPLESVVRLAQICRAEGVPFMLDPAPALVLPDALFALCEWITPNETEAAFYAGTDANADPASIAKTLRDKGALNVLLKLGGRGAYIQPRNAEAVTIAPFVVRAVDTTAAGDTFNGAFAVMLASHHEVAHGGRFAAAAAALSVTRMGRASLHANAQRGRTAARTPERFCQPIKFVILSAAKHLYLV